MTTWPVAVRKPPSERSPGKAAFRLCAGFEGLSLTAYPDPASPRGREAAKKPELRKPNWKELSGEPWTIGYGHTKGVREGDICTLFQADAWLMEDLEIAAATVRATITVPLTAGEFDALVSIAYNLGRVPKSMRACLNGGITDKGVQMAPGSYGSALQQFPRNCRAAGVPMRGILRRRLAEACVYSDLPWEAACSTNIVKLELDSRGYPDPYGTTSLEETLERARQDVPIMRPDVSDVLKAPWPTATTVIIDGPIQPPTRDVAVAPIPGSVLDGLPSGLDGIPVQLPIPDEYEDDELLLDMPAATALEPEANGTAPALATQPAPARVPLPNPGPVPGKAGEPSTAAPTSVATAPPPVLSAPSGGHSGAAVEARPVPVAPPPIPKPVIIAPQTINPNALPTNADSAKNMADSTRMTGMVLVGIGTVVQVVTVRLGIGTAIGAVFFDLTRDPVVITLAVTAVVGALGWVTKRNGRKTFVKGVETAKGTLY